MLQWVIYDSYIEDYAQQQREKEREKEKKPGLQRRDEKSRKDEKAKQAEEFNKRYLQACQIIERMVNQNIYDEIAQDYRYWEDPSDEFREEEGTLLPLWKFSYERTKKMCVTDLCFNTLYYDLFAVCFGTREYGTIFRLKVFALTENGKCAISLRGGGKKKHENRGTKAMGLSQIDDMKSIKLKLIEMSRPSNFIATPRKYGAYTDARHKRRTADQNVTSVPYCRGREPVRGRKLLPAGGATVPVFRPH